MIVAIGGPSNAGKSNLAKLISGEYSHKKVVMLCQDDFVHSKDTLPRIREHIDWEHPDTINFSMLRSRLMEKSVLSDLVIIEGFMIYNKPEINALYDKRIFVEIDEETFRSRKTSDLRWGREPDWYISHIWRMHQIYGKPPDEGRILTIQGDNKWPLEHILHFLNT